MKAVHALLAVGLLLTMNAYPQQAERVRFEAVDIVLDSGDLPLAAYQFEFAAETGQITIVGIEGGDHAAFNEPPYYDPAALHNNKVIIAAFSTAAPEDLPRGRSRLATVHVQISSDRQPEYETALSVSATADGEPIFAELILETGHQP